MRWGLIGASTIASDHMIAALRSVPGAEILWLISGDSRRAAEFAAWHGITRFGTDQAAMLADPLIDSIYISSTNEKHFPQAMAAIAAGKHVLCEKPLAMTIAEARTMVRAALAAGVCFATNHHLRCAGSHRAIRSLIAAGRIGPVLSVRVHHAVHLPAHLQGWRIKDASAGGGVIPDITVHDADTVRFLLGEDPVSVIAQSGTSGMGSGVEDSAMSVWAMPSGAMVMSHESFTHPFSGTGIEIHGTAGSIFGRGIMTQKPVGTVELVTASGTETIPYSDQSLYAYAALRFEQAALGQGQPAASGWDGVKSLAVALAVKLAAQSGQRQIVDYGVSP